MENKFMPQFLVIVTFLIATLLTGCGSQGAKNAPSTTVSNSDADSDTISTPTASSLLFNLNGYAVKGVDSKVVQEETNILPKSVETTTTTTATTESVDLVGTTRDLFIGNKKKIGRIKIVAADCVDSICRIDLSEKILPKKQRKDLLNKFINTMWYVAYDAGKSAIDLSDDQVVDVFKKTVDEVKKVNDFELSKMTQMHNILTDYSMKLFEVADSQKTLEEKRALSEEFILGKEKNKVVVDEHFENNKRLFQIRSLLHAKNTLGISAHFYGEKSDEGIQLDIRGDRRHLCGDYRRNCAAAGPERSFDLYYSEEPFLLSHRDAKLRKPLLKKMTKIENFYDIRRMGYVGDYRSYETSGKLNIGEGSGFEPGKSYFINLVPAGSNIDDASLVDSPHVKSMSRIFTPFPNPYYLTIKGEGAIYARNINISLKELCKTTSSVTEKTCTINPNLGIHKIHNILGNNLYSLSPENYQKLKKLEASSRLSDFYGQKLDLNENQLSITFDEKHDFYKVLRITINGLGKAIKVNADGSEEAVCTNLTLLPKVCNIEPLEYSDWYHAKIKGMGIGRFVLDRSANIWSGCGSEGGETCVLNKIGVATTDNQLDLTLNLRDTSRKGLTFTLTGKGQLNFVDDTSYEVTVVCNSVSQASKDCPISDVSEYRAGYFSIQATDDYYMSKTNTYFSNCGSSSQNMCRISDIEDANKPIVAVSFEKIPSFLQLLAKGDVTLTVNSTPSQQCVSTASGETTCNIPLVAADYQKLRDNELKITAEKNDGQSFFLKESKLWSNCDAIANICFVDYVNDITQPITMDFGIEVAFFKNICDRYDDDTEKNKRTFTADRVIDAVNNIEATPRLGRKDRSGSWNIYKLKDGRYAEIYYTNDGLLSMSKELSDYNYIYPYISSEAKGYIFHPIYSTTDTSTSPSYVAAVVDISINDDVSHIANDYLNEENMNPIPARTIRKVKCSEFDLYSGLFLNASSMPVNILLKPR